MTITAGTDLRGLRGVADVRGEGRYHWVGDGFRVESLFSPSDPLASMLDPFLLLGYHAPYEYSPTTTPRGVGVHPHRGFEIATLAFEGSVAHHDSTGAGGVIRPDDVQWMTAAAGILHKEYHDADWAREGGRLHMAQLWVNLPADHKMDAPHYQSLTAEQVGHVDLPDDAGTVRVIAGNYDGHSGSAVTSTPINLWDVTLAAGASIAPSVDDEHNAAVLVIDGIVVVNGVELSAGQLAVLDRSQPDHHDIELTTLIGGRALVMTGQPIGEPVAADGPFVMNTRQELIEAAQDFRAGHFGRLD